MVPVRIRVHYLLVRQLMGADLLTFEEVGEGCSFSDFEFPVTDNKVLIA